MTPGDAVRDALDALAPSYSLRETIALLGGNRQAARAFGVGVRAVERWLTTGAERRKPGKRSAQLIAATQQRLAAEQLREQLSGGISVTSYFELCVSKDCSWRDKEDIEIEEPDEEELDALTQAWQANDREGMANAWQGLFLGGWGQGRLDAGRINDIDGLSIATRG